MRPAPLFRFSSLPPPAGHADVSGHGGLRMSMNVSLQPALAARIGRVLRAVGITRISTLNQDPKSLADQQALLRGWVADRFDGPVEWKFIAGQGSGENVDRQQVAEAEELVENGQYDLVVMEDRR